MAAIDLHLLDVCVPQLESYPVRHGGGAPYLYYLEGHVVELAGGPNLEVARTGPLAVVIVRARPG